MELMGLNLWSNESLFVPNVFQEEELSVVQVNLTKLAEEKGALQEKLDTNLKVKLSAEVYLVCRGVCEH